MFFKICNVSNEGIVRAFRSYIFFVVRHRPTLIAIYFEATLPRSAKQNEAKMKPEINSILVIAFAILEQGTTEITTGILIKIYHIHRGGEERQLGEVAVKVTTTVPYDQGEPSIIKKRQKTFQYRLTPDASLKIHPHSPTGFEFGDGGSGIGSVGPGKAEQGSPHF